MTSRFKKINKIASLYVKAQQSKSVTVNGRDYVAQRLPNGEYKVVQYGVIAWLTFNNKGIVEEKGNKQILDLAKKDMYKFPKTNEKVKNITIEGRSYVTSYLGDGLYGVSRFGPLGYVEFNINEILAEVGSSEVVNQIKQDMYKFPKNIFI